MNRARLILGRLRNLRKQLRHLARTSDNAREHILHTAHEFHASSCARSRVFDKRRRVANYLRTALGERANLLRHHRKAAPRVTRACRFNRRVEREQIRLKRDLIDDANDARDFGA